MARFDLPSLEEGQLKSWEEKGVLRRALDRQDNPAGDFVFFEGPPTANGKPGIHHLLSRAFKDVILRFRSMQGYRIDRKAGWDTHGLPVELEVEKQLGFTKKQDIEEYGIAEFNAKCQESVWKYLDLWRKSTRRVGFWIDLEDPYITYDNGYVETLWWILKEIDQKGLLYEGHRVTPHCPRCVTSLSSHELAQGYKDTEDPSVFVKLELRDDPGRHLLIWTTTPWTLPANVAVAVGADITYAEVRLPGVEGTLILAKERLTELGEEAELVAEMPGSELAGTGYRPLFATLPQDDPAAGGAYQAYEADFVSTEEGTGIVHVAPAYGEDDAELGRRFGLPTLHTVDATGTVTAEVPGQGKFFKDADAEISADLESRGLMYRSGRYEHTYPFCWRCGTPLLYYAKGTWYIRMSELRDRLQENNREINWVPSHIQEGRFGEWLREVKDWALSRERFWGTPLPVWSCDGCGRNQTLGGLDEIAERGAPKNTYYLQRHGEADSNHGEYISSWPEKTKVELTGSGRKQIETAAEAYAKEGIDTIYASDLRRTRQTAEIIAAKIGLEVRYDERLRELDVGIFNGRTEKEYRESFPSPMARFDTPPEEGESLRELRRRMVGFIKDMESRHAGQKILIVSHGDPLWMLETGFLGLSDEETMGDKAPYIEVGSHHVLEPPRLPYDRDGRVDVHRPFIDEVRLTCPQCEGEMRRVPDVIDVWFDSGAMPFAQWHYPFQETDRIDRGRNFPADYISEAIDQTRGWFYTLLAVSTLLERGIPYRNVICLGHVLDEKGQKMSKSKGNVVDPFEMMDRYGADAIRYYFFTVNQPGDSKRFDEKGLEEITKKVFLILWNVLSFHGMFAGDQGTTEPPAGPRHVLDRWILAELTALTEGMTASLEAYDVVGAARSAGDFVNLLSTWYVRRSRDRFKSADAEVRSEAVATLGLVLRTLARLMAPFTPFLADAVYSRTGGTEDSVHLDRWPDTENLKSAVPDGETLRQAMSWVREQASAGLERRAEAGIPVRQALTAVTVPSPPDRQDWMEDLLKEELNVLEVRWSGKDGSGVVLDTELTPGLKRMGAARELVRHVNSLRKEVGLTIKDRIIVRYETEGKLWKAMFEERGDSVRADVSADELSAGRDEVDREKEIEFDGERLWIGIKRL